MNKISDPLRGDDCQATGTADCDPAANVEYPLRVVLVECPLCGEVCQAPMPQGSDSVVIVECPLCGNVIDE